MVHHINAFTATMGARQPALHGATVAPVLACRTLAAGQAITLRAKQLSVLHITHGRVWVTLGCGGLHDRALAGDHFLSPGQSLTLLPGQALVMEPFEPSISGQTATAHFSWGRPA